MIFYEVKGHGCFEADKIYEGGSRNRGGVALAECISMAGLYDVGCMLHGQG